MQGKALCAASTQGTDPEWVELLLEYESNIDFKDADGKTALDLATDRGITMILKVILFFRNVALNALTVLCCCCFLSASIHVLDGEHSMVSKRSLGR